MAQQKIVILGAGGLIGSQLTKMLGGAHTVVPVMHAELDICDTPALEKMLATHAPDYLINCVAFLNTNRCEKEPASSYAINYKAVAKLAGLLGTQSKTKLVQFSTDYVFNGKTGGYGEDDVGMPISHYGLHKYLADEAILNSGAPAYILRIASVVGAPEGKNDLIKVLLGRYAGGASTISVVGENELSTSTPRFMAQVISALMEKQPEYGVYNCVAAGKTSWLEITKVAFDALGVRCDFEGLPANAMPMSEFRPLKSWLVTDKLAGVMPVPQWQDIIREQIELYRDSYLAVLKKAAA